MTIGERVRSERERLGMTQAKFDAYVGLGAGHTSVIESRGTASRRTIEAIANRLGIRHGYLAFGEEPRVEREIRRRKTA